MNGKPDDEKQGEYDERTAQAAFSQVMRRWWQPTFRLKVAGRGVEAVEQLERLRSLKCNRTQEHLFVNLTAEEIVRLLVEGRHL